MRLIEWLEAFNRKERFFLVGNALGNTNFNLSEEYRTKLHSVLGIHPPQHSFVAMDYHLDWIHAGLFLSRSANQLNNVHENKVPIVTANQEDIDLLVAFEDLGVTHLLMIEAKAATGWTNKQTLSKADRLREMFGEGDGRKKYPGVKPSFCLTSPRPPQQLDSHLWPSWMAPGGQPIWLELEVPPGRRRITRCDQEGKSSASGDFFRVI